MDSRKKAPINNILYDKEYEYELLIYEGGYKNGIKNGKGKEYYGNGKIKFEGEYKNGIKWNGKMYDFNNNEII